MPGAGAYSINLSLTSSKGLRRRSFTATIGNARKEHSRNLWAKEEKNGAEVPAPGMYNSHVHNSLSSRITPASPLPRTPSVSVSRESSVRSSAASSLQRASLSSLMSANNLFDSPLR